MEYQVAVGGNQISLGRVGEDSAIMRSFSAAFKESIFRQYLMEWIVDDEQSFRVSGYFDPHR